MKKLIFLISAVTVVSAQPIVGMNQQNEHNDKKRLRDDNYEENNKKQKLDVTDLDVDEIFDPMSVDEFKHFLAYMDEKFDQEDLVAQVKVVDQVVQLNQLIDKMSENEFGDFLAMFPHQVEYTVDDLTAAMKRVKLKSATGDDIQLLNKAVKNINFNDHA